MLSAYAMFFEIICPVMGCITAFVMYGAPLRDAHRAVQKGDIGDLNPLPWAFMLGNCYGWIVYSMLLENYYLFFGSAPGFLVSIWLNLQAVKLQYQAHQAAQLRHSLATVLQEEKSRSFLLAGQEQPKDANEHAATIWKLVTQKTIALPPPFAHDIFVMVMVIFWLSLTAVITFGRELSDDSRQMILGVSVNMNLVFFYGAPLSTIYTVLTTRSSASMHVLTMLTNTANGCFWFAYGLAVWDLYILIPNGLGALLGVVQICLRIAYPSKHDPEESVGVSSHNPTTKDDSKDSMGGSSHDPTIPDGDSTGGSSQALTIDLSLEQISV
jgi:solute carrier family 50 protein (sugar transporter)